MNEPANEGWLRFQAERRADADNVDRLAKRWADDLGLDGTDEVDLVEALIELADPTDTIHTIATAAAVVTRTTILAEKLVEVFEAECTASGTTDAIDEELASRDPDEIVARLFEIAAHEYLIDSNVYYHEDEVGIRRQQAVIDAAIRIMRATHLGWNR